MTGVAPGRLLSVALTEAQVRARTKTETRRLGWWTDKHERRLVVEGDRLQLVRKAMGRKPGEPVVVIARVEVTGVCRERLDSITPEAVAAEGFPEWTPAEFVEFFTRSMRCEPDRTVTVIRWRYLDEGGAS